MQQYTFEDQYKGQPRKLLILMPQDGLNYRVFCGPDFLGAISPVEDATGTITWKTDYNILKPIAKKIGEAIESQQRSALTE